MKLWYAVAGILIISIAGLTAIVWIAIHFLSKVW